jgi:sugar phosphate isomerase/epimerase
MWSIGMPEAQPERPMDAHGLLDKAIELGVSVIQFGPNLPLQHLDGAELNRLVQNAAGNDISIELATTGLDPDHIHTQLQIARSVGATFLRTVPEIESNRLPTPPELEEQLRLLLPSLAQAGVRLGIENYRTPAKTLAAIVRCIDSPWIGVTLDTVNSLAVPEGPDEVVRELAPHTFCLHIKDFAVNRIWHRMGFSVEGREAGAGQLDIPSLIDRVAAGGTAASAILELWPPQQSHLESTIALEHRWATASIAYLRQFISD